MGNIITKNLDVQDFVLNEEVEKIASVVSSLSNNARVAYLPTTEELSRKEDKDFALIVVSPTDNHRKYACYNSELTEININFLANEINGLPEEIVKVAAANLTCSAKKFNIEIPDVLKKYASKRFVDRYVSSIEVDRNTKTASLKTNDEPASNNVFALEGKYPLNDSKHILKAAEWFDTNYAKLNIDQIVEFTDNLSKAASEKSVDIEKTAAAEFIKLSSNEFNPNFLDNINARKRLVNDEDSETLLLYDDLIKRADEIGPIKCAYVVEVIDKDNNLDKFYGKKIIDPLRSCVGFPKEAEVESDENSLEIDGSSVTLSDLRKLNKGKLTVIVGNDMIKELTGPEGVEILASLPKPIRLEILDLLETK